MKVLLIRPPRIPKAIALGEFMYSEPIGLEMVYTVLKDKYEVEIFDMMADKTPLSKKISSYNPHVVAITSLCIDVFKVLNISRHVKKIDSNIVTIVGGTQANLNPDSFKDSSIDHIMKYSTRNNLLKLYDQINNSDNIGVIEGVISKSRNYSDPKIAGCNEYIIPDRTSTAKYRKNYSYFGYKPAAIMGTSQGCSKTCRFCLRWRLEGASEEYIDMESVLNDLKNIHENYVMIYDNDFIHNGDRINEFCEILENNNIKKKFICYGSVNGVLSNMESLKRFHKNGLVALLVGYETFKPEEMKYYMKKSSVEDNLKASRFLKFIGVDVWASFMVHPDWSVSDFRKFRKYIKELNPEVSTFSPLTPFPNLPLYEEYKDRLIVKKEDYEDWSFGQVTIMPEKMSLRRYYYETLKTIFYINLFTNNIFYMSSKFGLKRMVNLSRGSVNLLFKYLKLMVKNGKK